MSLAVVHSRALTTNGAPEVTVEVHLSNGLPSFSIVGLPDPEVRESRERVRAALLSCQFSFPTRRMTVNLAPADLPKESGHFDLPIALGILAASGQLPIESLNHREFAGELSLTGTLRPIRGAFAMACGLARRPSASSEQNKGQKCFEMYLPCISAEEAAFVPDVTVFGVTDLLELCQHLSGVPDKLLTPIVRSDAPLALQQPALPDMADVMGQGPAKRALEVAAAGAHHLLMVGPPGSGKSMLATRLIGILPPLTNDEALTCAALLSTSAAGFSPHAWRQRPFRAPHHSASAAALVGGGNPPRPGEMTLAHHGVLFLDELPEFDRRVLNMLREPLEMGAITLSRAACQIEFPAACQLVAAMNPCPCGWLGDPRGKCRCRPEHAARYRRKVIGPLLDRIDLQIEVPALSALELADCDPSTESSAAIAKRVAAARTRQIARQQHLNACLCGKELDKFCRPSDAGQALLRKACQRLGWSARAYHRVLKIARTIADLSEADIPQTEHIAEAIQYRRVFEG
jgi:magnesium chelatase family protein